MYLNCFVWELILSDVAHQQYKNTITNITQLSNVATLRNQLNKLYHDKFVAFVERQDLSVQELSKLTVPYIQPYTTEGILFKVYATGSLIFEDESSKFVTEEDKNPIESVMLGHDNYKLRRKCFTFFSHLNKKYRDYKLQPDEIAIYVSSKHGEEGLSGAGIIRPRMPEVGILNN